MHYRDSWCPVPPSYVYLQVSLMGLVHWGGGGTGHHETITLSKGEFFPPLFPHDCLVLDIHHNCIGMNA